MKWRPIETAPKDGTWVLVFCPRVGRRCHVEVANWRHGYFMTQHGSYPLTTGSVTHWMPLPEPPKE